MGKVIYSMNVSLDGYVETSDHSLDWTVVDEEIHSWWNEQVRQVDAFVWGRRLYELMAAYWPNASEDPAATPAMREFAEIVNPKPKVVFSSSLSEVGWNSRLMRGDVGAALSELRREFDGDLDIGGPNLAEQFIRRGLVDEYRVVIHPVAIGAGTPFFPALDGPMPMRQTDMHRFESGALFVGYSAVR